MIHRILFLDIDGVLNGHEFDREAESCSLRPDCVRAFNRILRTAEPTVIVSSAWRYMVFREVMTWPGFGYMLRTHGVHRMISGLIGGCTRPDDADDLSARGRLVQRWIDDYTKGPHARPMPNYVVLDDAPIGMDLTPVEDRLVQTDGRRGLTEADADRVIAMLLECRPDRGPALYTPWQCNQRAMTAAFRTE